MVVKKSKDIGCTRSISTVHLFCSATNMVFIAGIFISALILQEVDAFSCQGRPNGYYADVQMGCQTYHMCDGLGRMFTYSCPNTTLFQQRMLICDHWYMVNCSLSENDYSANLLIGQRDKPFVDDNDEHPYQRTPRPDLGSFQKLHHQYHYNYEEYSKAQNLVGDAEGAAHHRDNEDKKHLIKTTPRSAVHSWSTEYNKADANTEIPLQFASTHNVVRSSSTPPPYFRQHEPPARGETLKKAEPTPRSLPARSFGGTAFDSSENTVNIPSKYKPNLFQQQQSTKFPQSFTNKQMTSKSLSQTPTQPQYTFQTTPRPTSSAVFTRTTATGFSSSGPTQNVYPLSPSEPTAPTAPDNGNNQNVPVPNSELEPPFLEPQSQRRYDFLDVQQELTGNSREEEQDLSLNVSPPSIYYQPPKLEVYKGFEQTTMDPITFAKIVPVRPYNPILGTEKTTAAGVASANHVRSLEKDEPKGVTISTNEGGDVTVTASSNRQDARENLPVKEQDEKKWKLLKKLFFIPDYTFPLDTVTRPSYNSGISSY